MEMKNMLNSKMCCLARLLTGDSSSDEAINAEYIKMPIQDKKSAFELIHKISIKHNAPFDLGNKQMRIDFDVIANNYCISPATLFCIYMELLSQNKQ